MDVDAAAQRDTMFEARKEEPTFTASKAYVVGYGLNVLMATAKKGVVLSEEQPEPQALDGVFFLQSVLPKEEEIKPITSLERFRPFAVHNSQEAYIEWGSVQVFRAFDTWEDFMMLLQDEFSPQVSPSLFSKLRFI